MFDNVAHPGLRALLSFEATRHQVPIEFREVDVILSPNVPFVLAPGCFDGFPTGCCVDAGMRGTAIFATDEFDSARSCYTDGEDIVLVKYDVRDIVGKIEKQERLNYRAVVVRVTLDHDKNFGGGALAEAEAKAGGDA